MFVSLITWHGYDVHSSCEPYKIVKIIPYPMLQMRKLKWEFEWQTLQCKEVLGLKIAPEF